MSSPPRANDPHQLPGTLPAAGYLAEDIGRSATASGPLIRPVDLIGLDDLNGDALALFCWSDVRPLKGVLGLVDWRLGGSVSRAMEAGLFAGHMDETLLLPAVPRMGTKRLFIFGLGPRSGWDTAVLRQGCKRAADVLARAGTQAWRLGCPAALGDVRIEQAFVKAATEALGLQQDPILVERL